MGSVPPAASAGAAATETTPAATFEGYRRYTGRVGQLPVVVELLITDSGTAGTYYYQRRGGTLGLKAAKARPDQPLLLEETAGSQPTGRWQSAQAPGPRLSGTWRSVDGRRELPFELTEDYTGAVRYAIEWYSSQGKKAADSVGCLRAGDTASYALEVVHLLDADRNPVLQRIQKQLLPAPYPTLQAYADEQTSSSCEQTEQQAQVTYNADQLLSLTRFEQIYQFGGAHPTHEFTPLTFDLRTGRRLLLPDLLKPGYEQPLRRLLTKRLLADNLYGDFYRDEGGQPGQPFERWTDEQGNPQALVPLPGSGFSLMPGEISFQWNEYEIGPYVIGPQTVNISYADLRPLLRPTGPLAPVLARFK
ncbi:RsiV family protein [Hymenobacter sp. CRA2]|uniref:RsiV family protein n=1 Tax=Hymenobacter sp. CRA2 TaxID=1955620 RepID=UPI0009D25BC9|nr:RsiV family protein [Hymenobacter sp. CRA2]OON70064.1 hypothetical protein B0919_04780 [Hymenobacter sp. CRA2]